MSDEKSTKGWISEGRGGGRGLPRTDAETTFGGETLVGGMEGLKKYATGDAPFHYGQGPGRGESDK